MIGGNLEFSCGDDRYVRPAPVVRGVKVTCASSGSTDKRDWDALVDTGADATVIPEDVVKALGMVPYDHIGAKGFDRGGMAPAPKRPMFHVELDVPGLGKVPLNPISAKRSSVLLGRDFLGKLMLLMEARVAKWAAGTSPW